MICYLNGIVENISSNSIILDVNGIGYQILVSANTLENIPSKGNRLKIYTYMNVREDSISLYGFLSNEELNMFNLLITVSGIGAKVALGILSSITPYDISLAILTEDISALSKCSGVGKKTAGRIILDLKDKLKQNTYEIEGTNSNFKSKSKNSIKNEAIEALTSLGYAQSEATKSVISIYNDNLNLEELIKLSLKQLSKF